MSVTVELPIRENEHYLQCIWSFIYVFFKLAFFLQERAGQGHRPRAQILSDTEQQTPPRERVQVPGNKKKSFHGNQHFLLFAVLLWGIWLMIASNPLGVV